MSDRTRHDLIASIFLQVRRCQGSELYEMLRQHCGDDAQLRWDVERMLAADLSDSFLEAPLLGPDFDLEQVVVRTVVNHDLLIEAGRRLADAIGNLEIERIIGSGAMGVVYLARQRHPARMVALKVLRPGLLGPNTLQRFQREADVLARLEHACIARIHATGTADAGDGPQPYVLMEYIRGTSLRTWSTDTRATVAVRLQLIAEICDGLEHAHQHGVVHRDLKPENILVTHRGEPRVLDFGVARLIGDAIPGGFETMTGQVIGTVPYMSPEQASGKSALVDGRSDIYALGVLLFETLCGTLPHDLLGRPPHEAARIICEEDPRNLGSLDAALRGDIETICAKAMARRPEDRYQAAAAMADDIRRFLAGKPIVARRIGTMQRCSMFIRRHRALFTVVVLIFAALASMTAISIRSARIAAIERESALSATAFAEASRAETVVAMNKAESKRISAEEARRESEAILTFFLNGLLRQANRHQSADRDVTLADAIEQAAQGLTEAPIGKASPTVRARIHLEFARIHDSLGRSMERLHHAQSAYDLFAQAHSIESRDMIDATTMLGRSLRSVGRYAESERHLRAMVEHLLRTRSERHSDTTHAMKNLAETLLVLGRWEEAEAWAQRAATLRSRHSAALQVWALNTVAEIQLDQGRIEDARATNDDALNRLARQQVPVLHPAALECRQIRASIRIAEGDGAGAAVMLQVLLDQHRSRAGAASPGALAVCLVELARARLLIDDPQGCIAALHEAVSYTAVLIPDDHPFRARMHIVHAEAKLLIGDTDRAVALAEKARTMIPTALGDGHHWILEAEVVLARAALARHLPDIAHLHLVQIHTTALPDRHALRLHEKSLQAELASIRADSEAAMRTEEAVHAWTSMRSAEHPEINRIRTRVQQHGLH